MNNIWVALLLVSLLSVLPGQALAQTTEQEQSTWGEAGHGRYAWTNGKAWKVLDSQTKIGFLKGIEEGIFLLLRQNVENAREDSNEKSLGIKVKELTIGGFRFSDLAEQIDDFYADSSNVKIPVVDAYTYTLRKLRGAKRQDLEDLIAALRARYNH